MEPTAVPVPFYPWRTQASRLLRAVLEAVVLALVCLAPWAYGAVHPGFVFLLCCGLAVLLVLWGARMLVEGRLAWQKCPVALCLAVLFLAGVGQITPLPRAVLGWLSPATVRLQDQLLPAEPEVLPDGSAVDTPPPSDLGGSPSHLGGSPGSTLSLYPTATRARLLQLLAVFLVFVVVRNNLAPGASWRLAVVAVGNGVLLATFALAQFFSSPRNTLYWTYPSLGDVYGPFICRNHFPFYLNTCVGLGLGLLWGRRSRASSRLLDDAPSLWLCAALALMLTSVLFSLSRGGWLALTGAGCVCLLLWWSSRRGGRGSRIEDRGSRIEDRGSQRQVFRSSILDPRSSIGAWGVGLLILALAIGLACWIGLGRVEARLASFWDGAPLQTARLPMWGPAFRVVRDFPVVGIGAGVYPYVDPLYRTDARFADYTVDHLHNDYLELLVEGGSLGLLLGLLAIALVLRRGYRAVRVCRDPAHRGLALGYLFAFLTLLIHSFGDFGIHIPAITLLATVLCAHLCALDSQSRTVGTGGSPVPADSGTGEPPVPTIRDPRPLLGAAACVSLGLMLCSASWRAHLTEGLRREAYRLGQNPGAAAPGSPARGLRREKAIAYLRAAVDLSPDDAELHAELAQAHLSLFGEGRELLARDRTLRTLAVVLAWPVSGGPGGPAGASGLACWLGERRGVSPPVGVPPPGAADQSQQARPLAPAAEQLLVREHLLPALRHHLRARDLCPLLPGPQMGIALNAAQLRHADPRDAYMARARLLAPADPTLWYSCGIQELLAGQPEQAWRSWRHCLEVSDRYLAPILERTRGPLDPEGLVAQVLPERPELLLAAATWLEERGESALDLAPLPRKVLALVDGRPQPWPAEDLSRRAGALELLGRRPEALAAFQEALSREPQQVGWRFAVARLLHEEGRLQEAREELLTVLAQQPWHPRAGELLKTVTLQLARQR